VRTPKIELRDKITDREDSKLTARRRNQTFGGKSSVRQQKLPKLTSIVDAISLAKQENVQNQSKSRVREDARASELSELAAIDQNHICECPGSSCTVADWPKSRLRTQNLDCWKSKSELRTLESGLWTPKPGLWTRNPVCGHRNLGCWLPNPGCGP
jgi:hypothetical protein